MNTHDTTFPARQPLRTASFGSVLARAWATFEVWHARVSERRALERLTPRMLRDIGMTREAVETEIRKSFWQA